MLTAELFIIAKDWRQPKGPSTEKWMNKQIMIYPYNRYYSIIKRNKPLIHPMNFKSIKLNERSLGQEATFYVITLKDILEKARLHR